MNTLLMGIVTNGYIVMYNDVCAVIQFNYDSTKNHVTILQ